uniref:Uncharacterized protein n=2 Tax=Florenciella parvula TaxID=236787 RepID=A0A7S2B1F0_9STRA|mmetsp:Transcript_12002/g.25325  ORF Transcript_12002/g.25325 Transcript_12002/m.25325 type:complete len:448 (+) Transcript_12002:15-1358(+)
MRGDVVSITPTYYDLQSKYHFVALKPYPLDTDYMMGTVDIEKTQKGPVYLWNWRKNQPKEFVQLTPEGEVYDCHDLNWNVGGDGFWVTTGDDGFSQYEQKTGTQIAEIKFSHYLVNDPNHLQMIDTDSFAILSSRGSNSILKINVNTQQAKWIMGGQNSSMDMYDEYGRLVPAHSPEDEGVFFGQHNAEYMGDDKYYLFNDGDNIAGSKDNVDVRAQNASSLMIIKVVYNESARGTTQEFTGHVVWRYDLGVYTQFYGDHDRLMNGNSLGTFWNSVRNAPGVQAQSYLLEVTEGKEVAWSLKVYGNNTAKKDINSHGWLVYSSERFYEKPTISRVSCKEFTTPAGPSITVYFTAHNNFRQNNVYQGTYFLSNPSHLPGVNETEVDLKGTFDFVPYWQDTKIEVTWENVGTCDGTTITVENQWGQRTNTTFAYAMSTNSSSTNTSSAF